MQGPVRPILGSIPSLFDSLSGKQTPFPKIGAQLKNIIEAYKKSLAGYNLAQIDLKMAALSEANLRGANLNNANLQGADLSGADLAGVNFGKANLKNVVMTA
ncbi:MAG: pentapeptide repeat-containing protein, partial [Nitrospinae bacterium]|nr:pentapeptide repeat-containing protein [Nitrospinota bacterium]